MKNTPIEVKAARYFIALIWIIASIIATIIISPILLSEIFIHILDSRPSIWRSY
ncbi:hypothetical protein [Dyadobacter sp. 3J3]|uniref:hypothetical protein n=1 Tax=Dyadobacter sp. 3J3 TaxID=2606600 RepID=UPI001357D416|nr:hypothetical protein [Dyadobacter sp. 3J3]